MGFLSTNGNKKFLTIIKIKIHFPLLCVLVSQKKKSKMGVFFFFFCSQKINLELAIVSPNPFI